MRLERVLGTNGIFVITESGMKNPIGNKFFSPGELVCVDDNVVYGNENKVHSFTYTRKIVYFKLALIGNMGNEAKIATFTVRNNKIILVKNEDLDITKILPRFYFSANNKTVGFFHWFYNPIEGPSTYGKINYYFNGNWYSLEHSAEVKDILSQVKTYPYSAEVIDLYSASNLPPYDEWPEREVDYYETQYMGDPCYALFLENKFIITMSISVNYIESRLVEEWYWKDRTPTEIEIEKGYVRISYDDDGNPQYRYKAYNLVKGSVNKYKVDIIKLSIDIKSGETGVEHYLLPYEKYSNYITPYAITAVPNEFRYSSDLIVKLTKDSDYIDFYYGNKKELSLKIQIKSTGNNTIEIAKYIANFLKVIRLSEDTYIVGDQLSKFNLMYKGEIIDSYDLGQFSYQVTNLSEPFFK